MFTNDNQRRSNEVLNHKVVKLSIDVEQAFCIKHIVMIRIYLTYSKKLSNVKLY